MYHQLISLSIEEFCAHSVGIKVRGELGYADRLVFVSYGDKLNLRTRTAPPYPYLTVQLYQTFAKVVIYNADGTEEDYFPVMPGDSIDVTFT